MRAAIERASENGRHTKIITISPAPAPVGKWKIKCSFRSPPPRYHSSVARASAVQIFLPTISIASYPLTCVFRARTLKNYSLAFFGHFPRSVWFINYSRQRLARERNPANREREGISPSSTHTAERACLRLLCGFDLMWTWCRKIN
jgi:hypothetical protein